VGNRREGRNGGSVQQTMLAIQALNPDAFIDGNINR
jgi:pilus assembly protein FimV